MDCVNLLCLLLALFTVNMRRCDSSSEMKLSNINLDDSADEVDFPDEPKADNFSVSITNLTSYTLFIINISERITSILSQLLAIADPHCFRFFFSLPSELRIFKPQRIRR